MADIRSVGVIGAGQMGSGIAHVSALAGYDVFLNDLDSDRISAGISQIEHNMARQVGRGLIDDAAMKAALARIKPASIEAVAGADIAIEAATENEETKKAIFRSLLPHLGPNTLLASNTSSISITRLASTTDRPERFIGLHFMNPVPAMPLVELVRGIETADETAARAAALAAALGKTVTRAADRPGFIVNRILMPQINEAFYCLMEGVGSAEDIDRGMVLGCNVPMGPLALADFIGLDTVLAILRVLANGTGDPKYRPCPLLVQYVDAGRLGKKTWKGVFVYARQV